MSSKDVKVRLLLEDKVSPELKKINKEVNNINSSFKKVGENGRALSKAIQQATQSAKALNSALKQTNALKNQVNQMKQYNTQIQKAVQNANKLNTTLKGINSNKNINVNTNYGSSQKVSGSKSSLARSLAFNKALTTSIKYNEKRLLNQFSKSTQGENLNAAANRAYNKYFSDTVKDMGNALVLRKVKKNFQKYIQPLKGSNLTPEQAKARIISNAKTDVLMGLPGFITKGLANYSHRTLKAKGITNEEKYFAELLRDTGVSSISNIEHGHLSLVKDLAEGKLDISKFFSARTVKVLSATKEIGGAVGAAGLAAVSTTLKTSFATLAATVATATKALSAFASSTAQSSDERTRTISRLGLVSNNAEALYDRGLDEAIALGADSSAYTEVLAGLATRTSEAFTDANGVLNEDKMMKVASAMFSSGVVSGSSTQEIAASNLQLLQALGSGVLQGDEFRSLRENNPVLVQAIADYMGVSTSALKEMGSNGELTTDVIIAALEQTDIADTVKKMPMTFERFTTTLKGYKDKAFKPIYEDFGSIATFLSNNLLTGTSGLHNGVSNAWANVKQGFNSALPNAYGAVHEVRDSFERMLTNQGNMKGIGSIYGELATQVTHILSAFSKIDFSESLGWIRDTISGWGSAFEKVTEGGGLKALMDLVSKLAATGGAIAEAIAPLLNLVIKLADSVIGTACETIINMVNAITDAAGNAGYHDISTDAQGTLSFIARSNAFSSMDERADAINANLEAIGFGGTAWKYEYNNKDEIVGVIVKGITEGWEQAFGEATSSSTTTGSATTPQYTVAEAETVKEVYDNSEEIQAELTAIAAVSGETLTTVDGMCSEISTMIGELVISASTWGYDFVNNLSAGIMSGYSTLIAAMDSIVAQLSRPEFSINHNDEKLRGQEKWGTHYVENLSNAIHNAIPVLSSAVGEVANTLAFDSDGKLDDNMVSTLRDFRSSDNNRSINNNMPVNITFGDVHQNADMNYISKQLELSLRNALSASL